MGGLRQLVAGAVAARVPVDEREQESQQRFLELFGGLERPFDRHAGPVHVTGSGIVTGPRGVLLHLHRRLGIWLQPGGHLDAGETPWEAAVRETREETGIPVRLADPLTQPALAHVDVHPAAGGHTHLDLRYLLVPVGDDQPDPPAGESPAVRWFSWPEARAAADPGLAGALAALDPGAR